MNRGLEVFVPKTQVGSMESQLFDDLQTTLKTAGAVPAIDQLCQELRARKDYTGLFYAMLMKKRHELGVSPVPTGPSQDLPKDLHGAYEDAIREAGRTVGRLFLEDKNIPGAWSFYRMLGEPEPVAAALDSTQLSPDEDCQPIIEIAFHQGVNPRKGFDWILEKYGICSAITIMGGGEGPHGQDVRHYCIKKLVRALHEELLARLRAEIEHKQGFAPTAKTVPEMIAGRDWLFSDDFYHIDVSHLSAVTQMALQLDSCAEVQLARELCAYGKKLSPRFQYQADPPFDNHYVDYDIYLGILCSDHVEEGLAHFRQKAEKAAAEELGTFPAEVLVNLLMRIGQPREALQVARKYLASVEEGRLSCPGIVELCRINNDYATLAEVAREQGNAVNFMAGLIAAGNGKK